MINKIKRIIQQGKLQNPQKPSLAILFTYIKNTYEYRKNNWLMKLRKDSTFVADSHLSMCSLFPQKILDTLIHDYKLKSVLDVGCGTGTSLKYFIDNGADALGIENSETAIKNSPVKEKIIKHNLNKELSLNKKFDLVWCFEVIEHIHPEFEAAFLRTLTNHSSFIVLSAAHPGQGGLGHFNEQEPAYWIKRFSDLGYDHDSHLTNKLKSLGDSFSENILCFQERK
jgi:2-polyprenyl-3-methyl-5-hydroxy-6-metoxy-1,4-benzoquinol methylase